MSNTETTTTAELIQIRGPSALGGSPRRFLSLLWTLASLEFRLKFFGSVLGYFWQLMRPLLLFGVLFVVFTQFVRVGKGVPHYPALLLLGIVINTFFAEATSASVSCVVNRENLVRRIHFPRMVIPLSVVLTTYMNFVLNFVAVGVFVVFIEGVPVRLPWLELIPLIVLLGVFCTGIGMTLSALFVRYRDVAPMWDVALPIIFYGTPILYPIEAIHQLGLRHLMMCNPLAVIVQQARHALVDPHALSASSAIGGATRLLIPAAIVVAVCGIGYLTFNSAAPRIAEDI